MCQFVSLQSLSENHEKLSKVLVPLLANEVTLNSHLREYNITIQKLNETHDAINRQARIAQERVQVCKNVYQKSYLNVHEQCDRVSPWFWNKRAQSTCHIHSELLG